MFNRTHTTMALAPGGTETPLPTEQLLYPRSRVLEESFYSFSLAFKQLARLGLLFEFSVSEMEIESLELEISNVKALALTLTLTLSINVK